MVSKNGETPQRANTNGVSKSVTVVLIHWIYERHETNGINREGVGIRGKLY